MHRSIRLANGFGFSGDISHLGTSLFKSSLSFL